MIDQTIIWMAILVGILFIIFACPLQDEREI